MCWSGLRSFAVGLLIGAVAALLPIASGESANDACWERWSSLLGAVEARQMDVVVRNDALRYMTVIGSITGKESDEMMFANILLRAISNIECRELVYIRDEFGRRVRAGGVLERMLATPE